MISGAWVNQLNERGRAKSRILCARNSPLALILTFGKGRSSFTTADIKASGCKYTADQINESIQTAIRTGRVKVISRGVYRLTGEV